jgi:monoterpene epsilon-lactone hydrolase
MQQTINAFFKRREGARDRVPPTLEERRAAFAPADVRHPLPQDVSVTRVLAGGVSAHWLTAPGVEADRVLLYLHGGGYKMGSLRSHGELAARLGRAGGMRVLLLEYRLAPEHPFPAALDDAVAAWQWLRADQGLPTSSLAVAGDSAGGGLALALLVSLRESGQDLPATLALMSPWTDLTLSGASMSERAGDDPILTPDGVRQLAADYLAGADPTTALASPLFASMKGLPPMLVQAGGAEVLFSDAQRLAEAASAAGVEVTLEIRDGLPHVYQSVLPAPEATAATTRMGIFLRTRTRAGC